MTASIRMPYHDGMEHTTPPTVNDLLLKAITAQYPEGNAGMQDKLEKLGIEWHCPGRHGVVRNVPKAKEQEVLRILTYFFGEKCAWAKGRDLEFVHMCKVSPPPRKPWEWCGTSVLFEEWHQQMITAQQQMVTLRRGQTATFTFRGETLRGTICGFGRARVTLIVPDGRKFYMPPQDLEVK